MAYLRIQGGLVIALLLVAGAEKGTSLILANGAAME